MVPLSRLVRLDQTPGSSCRAVYKRAARTLPWVGHEEQEGRAGGWDIGMDTNTDDDGLWHG